MMPETPILVIAGPTASGKTALALDLAERLDGELVGADSVQVYRGFDIGSAKPTRAELRGIAHHLIDVVEPDEPIDAMRFAALADAAIESVAASGRLPIVVGGTGLWLRALVRGLVDLPPVDPQLRADLEREVQERGSSTLHARLAEIDARAAQRIHPNDALRIVRALEVHAQTGTPLGELRERHALGGPRRPTLFAVIDPPLEVLTPRIEERVDAMIERGWLDEVAALRARHGDDVRPLGSVGYREWMQHLRGELSFAEAREAVRHATRTYARKQRNWFRAEPGIDARFASAALALPELVEQTKARLGR